MEQTSAHLPIDDIIPNEKLIFKSSISFSFVLIIFAISAICALVLAQIIGALIPIEHTFSIVISSITTLLIMVPLAKFTRKVLIYSDCIVLSDYYNGNNLILYPQDISSVAFRTPRNSDFTIFISTKCNREYSSELGGITEEDYKRVTEVLIAMGVTIEKEETFWSFMKFDKQEK